MKRRSILAVIGIALLGGALAVIGSATALAWGPGGQGSGPYGGMMGGYGGNGRGPGGIMGGSGGMMGGSGGMMGGWFGQNTQNQGTPISLDQAVQDVQTYVDNTGNKDLAVDEVMEFQNNFYAVVKEKSTGTGAFELLVDKYTGTVYPEMGPNMMWNTKYGMMSGAGGMISGASGMMGNGAGGMMGSGTGGM